MRKKSHIKICKNIMAAAMAFIVGSASLTAYAVNTATAVDTAVTTSTETNNAAQTTGRQYIISKTGIGDFTTIQAGVDAAKSGDTLIIYPGTYDEIVTVSGKELNLTGLSKELCIIRSDSVSYRQSPLSIAAGTVSNLTIYGMYTGNDSAKNLTQDEITAIDSDMLYDSWERQKNYRGYAVHIDQNYLYGKSLTFDNCRIISENNHCVGIGSRGNSTITFNNCEITALGTGGCIYMHDSPLADVGGVANFKITNSYLTSYLDPYLLTFESMLPEVNTTYFTFQNVKASAVAYSDNTSYVSNNVNNFFDVETLAALNKSGLLSKAGYTTTAASLVNYLSREDTISYMTMLENSLSTGNTTKVKATKLSEGITYIEDVTTTSSKSSQTSTATGAVKHQVIAIYNSNNISGTGWCGINSGYLTSDSFGNTLVEMNYPQIGN